MGWARGDAKGAVIHVVVHVVLVDHGTKRAGERGGPGTRGNLARHLVRVRRDHEAKH